MKSIPELLKESTLTEKYTIDQTEQAMDDMLMKVKDKDRAAYKELLKVIKKFWAIVDKHVDE